MKIAIVLLGRYPTDKAYGVTTNATINCLLNSGHEVYVYSFAPNKPNNYKNDFHTKLFVEKLPSRILRSVFSKSNRLLGKISWFLYVRKYLNWVKYDCRNSKYDLIWARNYEVFHALYSTANKFTIELHSIPNKKQLEVLNNCQENLLIAPISKKILNALENFCGHMVFSPMGINENQIMNVSVLKSYVQGLRMKLLTNSHLEFVYIGKLFPGGVSKGVEILIDIARYAKILDKKILLKIVGGDSSEVDKFNKLIKVNNLENYFLLMGQMVHEKAFNELKNADIVILTKSKDLKYSGFPLKAVEALASGKLTLVESSEIYRDIFEKNAFVSWFDENNIEDIFFNINKEIIDKNFESKLIMNINYAKNFTWEKRTRNIVCHFS